MTVEVILLNSESVFGDLSAIIAGQVAEAFSYIDWGQLLSQIIPEVVLPQIDLSGLNPRLREDIVLLARGGWYPYSEMTLGAIRSAAAEIGKGNYTDTDTRMTAIFQEDYTSIKRHILANFHKRARVLLPAFQAHERGEYQLSVPVFLAQADGICFDAAKVQLYSKRADKRPKTTDVVDRIAARAFEIAILSPLATSLPLTANPSERIASDYPAGALNRHQVLHGESVDYGTKYNSYKAISLLRYLCEILDSLSKGAA